MLAFRKMMEAGQLAEYPVSGYVAAVSAGIVDDAPLLDLCYEEDSAAMVDLNCVMDDQGRLIEIHLQFILHPASYITHCPPGYSLFLCFVV